MLRFLTGKEGSRFAREKNHGQTLCKRKFRMAISYCAAGHCTYKEVKMGHVTEGSENQLESFGSEMTSPCPFQVFCR